MVDFIGTLEMIMVHKDIRPAYVACNMPFFSPRMR